MTVAGRYVLGDDDGERERLRLQHELWLPEARRAWRRAGLCAGMRVLDLGAGPGNCSIELARTVGPDGHVLALECSPTYVEHARAAAERQGLAQLEVKQHDLCSTPLEVGSFDLVWSRWVAMFLPRLAPYLQQVKRALRAGGRFVAHEYVHWDTFGLHPRGEAIARFGKAAQLSFQAAGGNADVNRRLPTLLAAEGFLIRDLRPLPVLGRGGDPWARWLERFVRIYGAELIRVGLWSHREAALASAEMLEARRQAGSYWMGPTVLELQAIRRDH